MRLLLKIFFLFLPALVWGKKNIKVDTLEYSFYINNIRYNNHIYNSRDSAVFDIKTSRGTPPAWDRDYFSNDKIEFFNKNFIFKMHVIRKSNSETQILGEYGIEISLKNQSFSQMVMGLTNHYFQKGHTYVIDTLDYQCGAYYFLFHDENKDKFFTYYINSSQIASYNYNDTPLQSQKQIDLVYKNALTEINGNKKLKKLNAQHKIEKKERKYNCPDSITTSITYFIDKNEYKKYEFTPNGNIERISVTKDNYRWKFFYSKCGWTDRDRIKCHFYFIRHVKIPVTHTVAE